MSAPFGRRADLWLRLALLAALGTGGGVLALLMAWVRSPLHTGEGEALEQPVQFDHRHHVRDDGIDCRHCHFDAWRSPTAGVPGTALCMNCHRQVLVDSPLLAPVRRSAATGEPLRWRRVHDLPDFVFFDHRAHVRRGVGCETCHGRVDRMAQVHTVASLGMGWCIDCHRDPAPHLRPLDRITEMGRPPSRAEGRVLADALDVHPPTHCSTCHR